MKITKSQLRKIIKEELENSGERVIGRYGALDTAVKAFANDIIAFRDAGGSRGEALDVLSAKINEVFDEVFHQPSPLDMMHAKAKGER